MNKVEYKKPVAEMFHFRNEDVITTSTDWLSYDWDTACKQQQGVIGDGDGGVFRSLLETSTNASAHAWKDDTYAYGWTCDMWGNTTKKP